MHEKFFPQPKIIKWIPRLDDDDDDDDHECCDDFGNDDDDSSFSLKLLVLSLP